MNRPLPEPGAIGRVEGLDTNRAARTASDGSRLRHGRFCGNPTAPRRSPPVADGNPSTYTATPAAPSVRRSASMRCSTGGWE